MIKNESSCKTTVRIKAEDGKIDEIVSTPGHKYYIPNNKINRNANETPEHASYEGLGDKWVSAKYLNVGDWVLLSDGKYGIVLSVETENCSPYTTYNLEVADFHTYYVGENGTLVHNAGCGATYDIDKLHTTQPKEMLNEGTVKYMMNDIHANGSSAVPKIPVYVSGSGRALVVDGHHRLEAFARLGYQRVPIKYVHANQISSYGRTLSDMLFFMRPFGGG